MKIYRVIYKSILMDEGEDLVEVKTFLDRNLALDYIKRQIMKIKKEVEDLEDYHVEEDESSYERYLDGRSMEDSVSIWLESVGLQLELQELELENWKEIQEEQKIKRIQKETMKKYSDPNNKYYSQEKSYYNSEDLYKSYMERNILPYND